MKAKGRRNNAFTLIEIIIVIFIISLTTALIMPNLWQSEERVLKSEAKRIGNTLRYIYDEAIARKQPYLLTIDLDNDSWSFESEKESRSFEMMDDIMFKDIIIPSLGEISFGLATFNFGPMGPEEPITVHLSGKETEYTVIFNHLIGRAKVHEGYVL